jgi:hypothetical protein
MKPSVLGGIIDHFNSEDKTVEKTAAKEGGCRISQEV